MRCPLITLLAGFAAVSLVLAGCAQPQPAPGPTAAPPVAPPGAVEPTRAPAAVAVQPTAVAVQPTAVPAQPTAVPAKKVDFPIKGRAITLIVPWAAGGPADAGTRILAPGLEKELGVPVEVVDKGGANTQVGITDLVRAKPDGHTIGQVTTPAFTTLYLDKSRGAIFDRKSFAPVAGHTADPGAVGVRADSPYKEVKDLVDAARANPGKVKIGVGGLLGNGHMSALLLQKLAGVTFAIVDLEGGAQGVTALLGGHVDAFWGSVPNVAPQAKSGQLRGIGVIGKQESSFLPGVKTFDAQGYKMYIEVASIRRVWAAPAGTPTEITQILGDALKKVLSDPEVIRKTEETGQKVDCITAAQVEQAWVELDPQVAELMAMVTK